MANESTTLAIYTHSMRRRHDDSADKIAILAGLPPPLDDVENIRDTSDAVKSQKRGLSDCLLGSRDGTEIMRERPAIIEFLISVGGRYPQIHHF